MHRAALIFNPRAGKGRHALLLPALLAALRQAGIAATARPTAAPGHATELARQAAAGGEIVLAFGGDGTVREAAAGLLGSEATLGILPGGTTNVLARALGIPLDPVAAAAGLRGLATRLFDVGLAGSEPFLMMVSAGLDERILALVDPARKRRFGQGAIAAQGLVEWWRYGYPPLALSSGERTVTGSFVAVANIPLYGGRYRLAPDACCDDGHLDALVFQGRGRRATLAFAVDLALARHTGRADVVQLPLREAVLSGPPETAFQIDGDVSAQRLPVAIRLAPEKLKVLAPQPQPYRFR
jgi:diacylglycerol kinase family enzyme